jgi:hypothetical protein
METRSPFLTAAEIDALLHPPPRTVREELEAVLAAQSTERRLARTAAPLRRRIAEVLHGAAQAIYPPLQQH